MVEYKLFEKKYQNKHEIVGDLNELGKDNWVLVSMDIKEPEHYGKDWVYRVVLMRETTEK